MSNKLKSLTIGGFRGATRESRLEFSENKKITMIFGENGTGKSTIVDAFSLLCEQDIGSVSDRSGGTINHIVSIGKEKKDVQVALETEGGTWRGSITGSSLSVSPDSGYPSLRVLRRSNILRLVEAQPSARFKELSPFLALSAIEKSEDSLRSAWRSTKGNLDAAVASTTEATLALDAFWVKEDSPGESSIEWAKNQKELDPASLKDEAGKIDALKKQLESLQSDYSKIATAKTALDEAIKADEAAIETLVEESQKVEAGSSELLSVLQSAKAFVNKTEDLTACPVCLQEVEKTQLSESIQTRITEMSSLGKATSATRLTKSTKKSKNDLYESQINSAVQSAIPACSAYKEQTLPCLSELKVDPSWIAIPENEAADAAALRIKPFIDLIDSIVEKMDARTTEIRESTAKRSAILTHLEQIETNEKNQEQLDRVLTGLAKALEIVETERKVFVSEVLESISKEVDRLYCEIHPGESIGSLTLQLKKGVKGSLLLKSDFHTEKEVPPQAYFSESHLDTLGLCIFIALAKKYKTAIVILDDVVTSVDSSHLGRVIKLIDDESEHFEHIIITTHYRPWRDKYRYHAEANRKIHFVELRLWTVASGIHVHTNKLAVDELEASLDPQVFDRQIVAQRSGILLESLLSTLSVKYGTSVPNKPAPDYTLGELLDSLSKLSRHLRIEHFADDRTLSETIEIKDKFELIKASVWVRNQVGAHFNLAGLEVSDQEVLDFGNATVDFARAIICPHSGSIPHKKNGTCWASPKNRTLMHPLERP